MVSTATGSLYDPVYGWALQDLFLAASSAVKQLLPTLLVSWGLGYRRRNLGLRAGYGGLTAVLLLLTMLLGLGSGTFWVVPLVLSVLIFVLLRSISYLGTLLDVVVTLLGLGAIWLAFRERQIKPAASPLVLALM